MNYELKIILTKCKNEIVLKYSGNHNHKLKHSDYLQLADEIFKESKVSLSLSTLKRIFNDSYEGIPNRSTLNAFANYLGLENWKEYCKKNGQKNRKINLRKSFIYIVVSILVIVALVAFLNTSDENKYSNVVFEHLNYNKIQIPATITFKYDIRNIGEDVTLHPLGYMEKGKDDIIKLDPNDSVITYTYLWPQIFYPKLSVNGKVIKENKIDFVTNKWLANISKTKPFYIQYFDNEEIFINGKLAFPIEIIKKSGFKFEEIEQTVYHLFKDFNGVTGDSLTFETQIKNLITERTRKSGKIEIDMFFDEGNIYLSFDNEKNSFDNLEIKVIDAVHTTKREDLSFLYHDFSKWTKVKCKTNDKKFELYTNDKLIFKTKYNKNAGELKGIRMLFNGLGEVDYVRFYGADSILQYNDEFE